ncbi:MAG: crossover junction endodeoxyribonuclease RuvC [Balneolaceae bacterium]|nr:crossover junction endodeoxyribonuclease RuvC [Balneolaceae bacterium]
MADIILGIDPGSRTTGYAILTEEKGKMVALRCDVINMADMEDHADRLQHIFDRVSEILGSFEPTSCAVETPIYGIDPLAMLKLGRAQAAAILAITNSGLEVSEYYPKEVKKSITGNGNASKEQVAYMLEKMVKLSEKNLKKDATDALAVAWCHMMKKTGIPRDSGGTTTKSHQNRKKSGWEEFISNNPDRVRE